jgi:hypothetical protein
MEASSADVSERASRSSRERDVYGAPGIVHRVAPMTAELQTKARRWPVAAVILAALLLHAPSLGWGFYADDFTHQMVLDGAHHGLGTLRPWALFDFGTAPEPGSALHALGVAPWWISPDWKLRFFRLIPSLTQWLDHALFGRAAVFHHAVSLGYFAVLLVLLHAMYLAAGLERRAALLALALFGVANGSIFTVGWLANRNSLLECVFAVSAVLVAMRAARGDSPPGWSSVAFSYLLALGACACKESGIAAPLLVAFVFRGSIGARRAAWIGPLASAGFLVFYVASGYGSRAAFYPTPWFESGLWFARLGQLAVFAPLGFVAPTIFDLASFQPRLLVPFLAVSAVLGLPLAIAVARAARAAPRAMFFAAWIALTMLPQAGAPPSERLLFVPMVGAAPWIAAYVERWWSRPALKSRLGPALVGASGLLFAGGALFVRGATFVRIAAKPQLGVVLSAEVPRDSTQRCVAFVLQSPSQLAMLSLQSAWLFETGDASVRFAPLQWGRRGLRWTTVDERTFDLETLDRAFLDSAFEPVFLSSRTPPAVGTRWTAADFEVEALRGDERGLRAIRVRLPSAVGDPRWRFLTWRDGALRSIPPPPIGASVELPRCAALDPLMP